MGKNSFKENKPMTDMFDEKYIDEMTLGFSPLPGVTFHQGSPTLQGKLWSLQSHPRLSHR